MSKNKKQSTHDNTIAVNRKAYHDYTIEDRIEAGLVLQGWEVKSLRAGRGQLKDSYVVIRGGEAWLLNTHITPLNTVSTHFIAEPERTRKLLLHRKELNRLIGAIQREGYTIIPLKMYWNHGRAKIEIAYAKGKKLYDKRASEKDRDWQREKQRIMKG
jgi:SsrA-binding protein